MKDCERYLANDPDTVLVPRGNTGEFPVDDREELLSVVGKDDDVPVAALRLFVGTQLPVLGPVGLSLRVDVVAVRVVAQKLLGGVVFVLIEPALRLLLVLHPETRRLFFLTFIL